LVWLHKKELARNSRNFGGFLLFLPGGQANRQGNGGADKQFGVRMWGQKKLQAMHVQHFWGSFEDWRTSGKPLFFIFIFFSISRFGLFL